MRFKSYEHLHLKTLTGKNDALKTLATVLHTKMDGQYQNLMINKYVKCDPNIL